MVAAIIPLEKPPVKTSAFSAVTNLLSSATAVSASSLSSPITILTGKPSIPPAALISSIAKAAASLCTLPWRVAMGAKTPIITSSFPKGFFVDCQA